MRYADFMAFPFSQHQLITKQGKLELDPAMQLDMCQTTSVPPFMTSMTEIIREHSWFVNLLSKQNDPRRLACFFGLQHPPQDAGSADLLCLKGLGIRFMTLAYEMQNEYGGGFAVPDERLTERGQELIEAMAETGMVLDLSHAGHRTARDAIEYIERKRLLICVVATHTACYAIYQHGRGLPDDVLLGIRDLGGLVGLVTISWLLNEAENTLDPFLHHLAYLLALMGDDKVCLGTDGVYRHINPEEEQERFAIMQAKIDPRGNFRVRYPEQAPELNCPDRLTIIEQKITELGWHPNCLAGVMGENLIRFLSKL